MNNPGWRKARHSPGLFMGLQETVDVGNAYWKSRSMMVFRPSAFAFSTASAHILRTMAEIAGATFAAVFIPDVARMWFFNFDTTTKTSLSLI